MVIDKFDQTFIDTVRCPPGSSKLNVYSRERPGLQLEVRTSGGMTWYQRYLDERGRQKTYRIGSPADISLHEVKKIAAKVRSRAIVGEDPAAARREKRAVPTYEAYVLRYLAHTATYQRSPETTEQYVRTHILPRWGEKHLDEIRQEDVAQWFGDMARQGYAAATIERMRVVFSHSLKLAIQWGVPGLTVNPVVGIPRPPLNNARERYLTSEEAARLRQAVERSRNRQLKYIIGLLLHTGCRVSEILHAEWGHLDLDRRLLRIPQSKTGKARFVPLSQGALDLIAQLRRLEDCPYLVPNLRTRKPWTGIFMSWDTARKQARIPDLRLHDLRHSAASFMAAAGIDLYTIGKVLGHSNHKTTQRYAHLSSGHLIDAVEAGAAKLGVDWTAKDK